MTKKLFPSKPFVFDNTTFTEGTVVCLCGEDWKGEYHKDIVGEIFSLLYKSIVLFCSRGDFCWIPVRNIESIRCASESERFLWLLDTEDYASKRKFVFRRI